MEVDGHHVVAGVSSWGLGCGQNGRQFAVYAEVSQVDLSPWIVPSLTTSNLHCCQVRTWIDETIAASGGAAPCNSTLGKKISGIQYQPFHSLELNCNLGKLGLVERVLADLRRGEQEEGAGVPLRRRGGCRLLAV